MVSDGERPRSAFSFSLGAGLLAVSLFAIALGYCAERFHRWRAIRDELFEMEAAVLWETNSILPMDEDAEDNSLTLVEEFISPPTISQVEFHGQDWTPPQPKRRNGLPLFAESYWFNITGSLDDQKMKRIVATVARLDLCPLLVLIGTDLTDEGYAELAALPCLRSINLSGAKISRIGLQKLAHLPITQLDLRFTSFDDAAISLIASFEKLEELDISGTRISRGGAERLKSLLPNCRILFDDAFAPQETAAPKIIANSPGAGCKVQGQFDASHRIP